MIVYHGSYCVVDKPTVLFSRDALDFGKGFYVTNIEEQAIKWSERFKVKFGKAYVNRYKQLGTKAPRTDPKQVQAVNVK